MDLRFRIKHAAILFFNIRGMYDSLQNARNMLEITKFSWIKHQKNT